MKTTKRSKMLLSSIAMLLVALVALGSATFAWYSINRTVTADDITVQAAAAGGLQISKTSASAGFANSVSLDDMEPTDALNPVALTYNASGVATAQYFDGASSDASASTGTAKSLTVSDGSSAMAGYWVIDQIWIKNGSAKAGTVTTTVTASGEGQTEHSFLKLALVPVASPSSPVVAGAKVSTAQTVISADAYTSQEVKSYWVVAYADGADADCYTDNTANQGKDVAFVITSTLTDA